MIKSYGKDFFVELQIEKSQKTNFFLQKNTLEYEEMYYKQTKNSYVMEHVHSYSEHYHNNRLFTGYLRLGDSSMITKPKIYDMTDLLTDIGGLSRSLFVILELANMVLGR